MPSRVIIKDKAQLVPVSTGNHTTSVVYNIPYPKMLAGELAYHNGGIVDNPNV